MRLRNAENLLANLQQELEKAGHAPDDPYRKAKIAAFWQKIGMDKRLVEERL